MPPCNGLAAFRPLKGLLAVVLSGCGYLIHDQGKDFERAKLLKPLEVPAELRRMEPPVLTGVEVEEEVAPEIKTGAGITLPYPLDESWPLVLKAVAKMGGALEDVDPRQHRFKMRLIGEPARTPLEEIGLVFREDPLQKPTYSVELSEQEGKTFLRLYAPGVESRQPQRLLKRIQEEIEALKRR